MKLRSLLTPLFIIGTSAALYLGVRSDNNHAARKQYWENKILTDACNALEQDSLLPSMATPITDAQANDPAYYYMDINDSTVCSWDEETETPYFDADSLIAQASRAKATHIFYDAGLERSLDGKEEPEYRAFALSDLKKLNDQLDVNADKLKLPPAKILIALDGEPNVANNTLGYTDLSYKYAGEIAITYNTGILYQSVEAAEDFGNHELGHVFFTPFYDMASSTLKLGMLLDTSKMQKNSLLLNQVMQYTEFGSDSVLISLSDGKGFMTSMAHDNKMFRDRLQTAKTENDVEDIGYVRDKIKQLQSVANDPTSTHPTDLNRLRNAFTIIYYNQSKDATDRKILHDMMVKPPLIQSLQLK